MSTSPIRYFERWFHLIAAYLDFSENTQKLKVQSAKRKIMEPLTTSLFELRSTSRGLFSWFVKRDAYCVKRGSYVPAVSLISRIPGRVRLIYIHLRCCLYLHGRRRRRCWLCRSFCHYLGFCGMWRCCYRESLCRCH